MAFNEHQVDNITPNMVLHLNFELPGIVMNASVFSRLYKGPLLPLLLLLHNLHNVRNPKHLKGR